jgi:uncharacterized repeat protein (TIGR01451 family)/LPXTG-motif cell wall-anchored protein
VSNQKVTDRRLASRLLRAATATAIVTGSAVVIAPGSATAAGGGLEVDLTYIVNPYFAKAGEAMQFSVLLQNKSATGTVTNVVVTDDRGKSITCPSSSIGPATSMTCTGWFTTTAADVAARAASVTVTTEATDVDGSPRWASNADSTPLADLTISKVLGSVTNTVGGTVSYVVTVNNTGGSVLNNLTITELVGFTLSGCTVSVPVPYLLPGQSVTCTATKTLTQADKDAGSVTNTVTATADQLNGGSRSATVTTALASSPTLTVSVGSLPARSAVPGDLLTFPITVTNTGDVTLTGIDAESEDPADDLECTTLDPLAPGATATCTLTHTVTVADLVAGTYTARVAVGDAGLLGTTSGREAVGLGTVVVGSSAVVLSDGRADLAVTGALSAALTSGSTATRTFTVTNLGAGPAGAVTFVDTLPAGEQFVSAGGSGWTCTTAGNVITCSTGALAAGATAGTLVVTTQVTAEAGTSLNHGVVVSTTSAEVSTANNSISVGGVVGAPTPPTTQPAVLPGTTAPTAPTTLPSTGSDATMVFALAGGVLVIAGAGMVAGSRRRRTV